MTYGCLRLWPLGSFVLLYKNHIEIPQALPCFSSVCSLHLYLLESFLFHKGPGLLFPFTPTWNYLLISLSSHGTLLITVFSIYNLNPNPDGERFNVVCLPPPSKKKKPHQKKCLISFPPLGEKTTTITTKTYKPKTPLIHNLSRQLNHDFENIISSGWC